MCVNVVRWIFNKRFIKADVVRDTQDYEICCVNFDMLTRLKISQDYKNAC